MFSPVSCCSREIASAYIEIGSEYIAPVPNPHIIIVTATKTNKIMGGVFILTVANIIVKIIGFAYKIPLLEILGENGMAYYNAAYSIYVSFYMISTAGIPVAVSRMIATAKP